MTRDNNPCYKCADRSVGCHANCEDYAVWKILDGLERKYNEKLNNQYNKPTCLDKSSFDKRQSNYRKQKSYKKRKGECK